jgi:gluconokinase
MDKRALALDLGSSSVRAVVFETAGPGRLAAVEGAIARRPRHVSSVEPGQATFGADSYLADLVACIDELGDKGHLEGVSEVAVDCQMHSVVPLDSTGRALTEVVAWADTRARPPVAAAAIGPDDRESLRQRTGCALAPMYWTWRVPWLAEADRTGIGPDADADAGAGTGTRTGAAARTGASTWTRTGASTGTRTGGPRSPAMFVGLAEYVGLALLGDPTMSVSMASGTGLLESATHGWDEEALEVAGIGPAALPPLASPGWEGRLVGDWKRRWPALAGARWHPSLIDGAAANLGMGCDTPSRAALTVGTSAAVRSVRPAAGQPALPAGLWRYCVDHERVVLGTAFSSGGQLYSWALALWEGSLRSGTSDAKGTEGAEAAAISHTGPARDVRYDLSMPVGAGSEGVLVMPWHAGTRPPATAVPAGEGTVVGLRLGHNGAHIVSATVEAVCFQLAEGLADLEADGGQRLEIVANGGAIERSPWWQQRLASTLDRAVLCSTIPESTARGAAANALGVKLSASHVDGVVVEPVTADVAALAQARRRWLDWYARLLPFVCDQAS